MLETMSRINIREDSLFSIFKAAVAEGEETHDFTGRYFKGRLEGSRVSEMHVRSQDPVIWRNMWEMVGFITPPSALPPECMFEFMTVSKPRHDTDIILKDAVRTMSGLKLDWECRHTRSPAIRAERAHYHMLILPKTDIRSTLKYI